MKRLASRPLFGPAAEVLAGAGPRPCLSPACSVISCSPAAAVSNIGADCYRQHDRVICQLRSDKVARACEECSIHIWLAYLGHAEIKRIPSLDCLQELNVVFSLLQLYQLSLHTCDIIYNHISCFYTLPRVTQHPGHHAEKYSVRTIHSLHIVEQLPSTVNSL